MATWVSSQRHQATRGAIAHVGIGTLEKPRVASGEVAAAILGCDPIAERAPLLGEDPTHRSGHPLDLPVRRGHDADQDHLGHTIGMSLRVREAERRAPRASPYEPSVDVEVTTQPLDVAYQMRRRVRRQVDRRGTRVRRALAAARVDRTARPDRSRGRTTGGSAATCPSRARRAARPRASPRVAGDAPRDAVAVTDIEHAASS